MSQGKFVPSVIRRVVKETVKEMGEVVETSPGARDTMLRELAREEVRDRQYNWRRIPMPSFR
jgi:hypothetical protein